MASKVLSGCIVAFWLVMMSALVRVEFFAKPPQLDHVPIERVLRKIFANSEPGRLYVYHETTRVGFCTFYITPLASLDARPADLVGPTPGAYWVQMSYTTTTPSRLKLTGQAWCDLQYGIQRFSVKALLEKIHLDIRGDNQTRKVDLVFDDGDTHQEQQLALDEVANGDLGNVPGIPLPARAALLGIAGLPIASRGVDVTDRSLLTTTAYYGHVPIGEPTQQGYVIESKLNEGMWVKIWVDESGQVLLVETSMGLSMRSAPIDDLNGNDRPPKAAHSSRSGA
jgi:hypothetical protein